MINLETINPVATGGIRYVSPIRHFRQYEKAIEFIQSVIHFTIIQKLQAT